MPSDVYVEIESHHWCLRHESVWTVGVESCQAGWLFDEGGLPCTPVPLYIEARDP